MQDIYARTWSCAIWFNTTSESPTWVCLVGPPYVSYSGATQPNRRLLEMTTGPYPKKASTNHKSSTRRWSSCLCLLGDKALNWGLTTQMFSCFEWRNEKDHPHSCDFHRSRSQEVEIWGYFWDLGRMLGWCPLSPLAIYCGVKPKPFVDLG